MTWHASAHWNTWNRLCTWNKMFYKAVCSRPQTGRSPFSLWEVLWVIFCPLYWVKTFMSPAKDRGQFTQNLKAAPPKTELQLYNKRLPYAFIYPQTAKANRGGLNKIYKSNVTWEKLNSVMNRTWQNLSYTGQRPNHLVTWAPEISQDRANIPHSPSLDTFSCWLVLQLSTSIAHWLGYVLPFDAHTGLKSIVHTSLQMQVATPSITRQMCLEWLHIEMSHGSVTSRKKLLKFGPEENQHF